VRTISANESAILTATGGRKTRVRVKVKDSGGTFRDLTTYPGLNLVLGCDWGEGVDSPGMDADIQLKRESEKISLAPLMTASPLNRAFAYPGSYAKLIDVAREVQIETATVADGVEPVLGDWSLQFHGYIDVTDAASGPNLTLRCADQQAKLRDTYIERERAYAFAQGGNATKGCDYWRPSMTYSGTGARGIPTEAKKNGHFYRITTSGTTGSTEPAWPTGAGATVTDGTVVWTESGSTSITAGTAVQTVIQQIIDDNLGSGVFTLEVPASPGWSIKAYKQERMSVWDAIKKLADQIGWDIRFKWHSGSSSFKLTLYSPDRAKVVPNRTFGPSERYPLKELSVDVAWIRNAVQVVYNDSADLDAQKRPKRKTVVRTDPTSVTAYGRRFCEVAEGETSNIDSATEANTLADAILSDLANPVADHACELPYFRHVELSDLLRWSSDSLHYDSNQDLAVTSYRHHIGNDGKGRTDIKTRGKPSAGEKRWHRKMDRDRHTLDLDNTGSISFLATDVVGGTKISILGTEQKAALEQHYAIHLSDSAGFTPSTSNLVSQGAATEVVVPDLIPGKTYYYKVTAFGNNRSRPVTSQPSAEQSFVAGRASSGHIREGIALGHYPLNGGFETRTDATGMPDHWFVDAPTEVGDDILVKEDGNGISGGRYLRLQPSVGSNAFAAAHSAKIPIVNERADGSTRYAGLNRCSAWLKMATSNNAANDLEIYCRGYDYAGTIIGVVASVVVNAASKTGHWQRVEWFIDLTGDAGYRSVDLGFSAPHTSGQFLLDLDEVRIEHLGTPWYAVGDTTKFTDNYEAIPGFQNSWVNYGGEMDAAFRRDRVGRVDVKGLIKSGTIGNVPAFTLPAGYRPTKDMRFAIASNSAFGLCWVLANGEVRIPQGNNTWVDLSGVCFETF
jgi:hypothetical protein